MTAAAESPHATTAASAPHVLRLRHFGIAYENRVVLSDVDLDIPRSGIFTLVGPTASGKSTLLRTVAGLNDHSPQLRCWGECLYDGEPISPSHRPPLVSQNTRLLTSTLLENLLYFSAERFDSTLAEKRNRARQLLHDVGLDAFEGALDKRVVELPLAAQRLAAIARVLSLDPALVLIDEPTTGLNEADARPLLDALRAQASLRTIVVVLHNQRQARYIGGHTALLAGGVIREVQPSDKFFDRPQSESAKEFCRSGTCADPSPSADAAVLDTGIRPRLKPPPEGMPIHSESLGPRGFTWLLPGKLAGTPRPGVVRDIGYDLEALKRVGVTALVSLTMRPIETETLKRYDLTADWYPIEDMRAPTIEAASAICTRLDSLLANGETVAVHCRAGLGRTGTVLAAYLIWGGSRALSALEEVRSFEPKWVQSSTQIEFLEAFADAIHSEAPAIQDGPRAIPASGLSSSLVDQFPEEKRTCL